jgi:zinc transporter ZupT
MLFYRTLVHALVILLCVSILGVLAEAAHLEGITLVLALLNATHYLLFAFAAAAALNRQRAFVLVLLALAVILTWPPDAARIVRVLLPVAAGVLIGSGLQHLFNDANRVRRTHGQRSQPLRLEPPVREPAQHQQDDDPRLFQ